MIETNSMDRRKFLVRGASFLVGSLLGLNSLSRALACSNPPFTSLLQPCIALIIDDIGCSLCRARQFLEFGAPITFAILPRLAKSEELAAKIHELGHEIMLHQPMEPSSADIDPGPGALYVGDGVRKISKIMEENITVVPFATGVNNHMGSKFTACQSAVQDALQVIKESGLFFIDSLTTNRSEAYKTAKELHMPTACRNVFLDNRLEEKAILRQLDRLKRIALKYGQAIGIGHPFPETARAIGLFLKQDLPKTGISLVHASHLLDAA
jgi:polysaccharide deacetylase 2 family uncharacterized protein YibQ